MRYVQLLRQQAAAAAGTAVDFLVTIACVEGLHRWYMLATVLGNVAGGLTNFFINRHLVFRATQQRAPAQGARYLLVWLGGMLLNATGVYLFTQYLHTNYLLSKTLVSLLIGLGFTYPLQVHFVFKKP
ncbi:GtrA family protein [Hymenobacter sp. BT175]|uniref:GtrA family protein n=1 Tax=Hymenobacter translucens TaxID=2886507 RepID=UPI001D0E28B6|nr:GtrA family protein [Hymenobacter translucens]MCC2548587.1 GtrA family protein [Hymenobacter translucens]